ncbi:MULTISPECIES: FecR family protein [Ensifer]|uniref:FecR family protein n=1 Tax=Ensifer adhaerens TaxID=106592 RepID=A0A9Q9DC25_ENSAD|nr:MULTISPECIES: FecR family protein [Ensifer]MBD9624394.1 FecR family protein [Ensifer sp. ENS06]USJ25974.1 FecR family protein [Ensifer adhaerens]
MTARDRRMREQAVDWLVRLTGDPDDEALQLAFERWRAEDPAHAEIFARAQRAIGDASLLIRREPEFAQRAVKRTGTRRKTATALAAIVSVGAGIFVALDGALWMQADVIAGKGERPILTLEDGSTLQLNAQSAVAYQFTSAERRIVLLRGEAFVQVAADSQRPFVVKAGGGTTTALGTAFDVNLTDDGTSVTVLEHAVSVATDAAMPPRRVAVNEQVSYDHDGRLGFVTPVDPFVAAAWRQGRLVFEERTIASVVEEIGRYVPGKILIADASVGARRVSGSFDLSDPVGALQGLAEAFDVKVTRIGPYVTILR